MPLYSGEYVGQSSGTKKYNASRKAQGRLNLEKWIRLKARNWTNAEIARRCGVSESAISQGIARYHESHPIPGAEEQRRDEKIKLDLSERRIERRIREKPEDLFHGELALTRVRERRAKLLGLDVVVNTRHEIIDTGASAPTVDGAIRVVIVDDAPSGESSST